MEMLRYGKIVLLVLLCTQFSMAARITVSKDGRGTYKSIQAAIDKAGPGDEVEILDVAVYEEQVTIDSTKGGLTLQSTSPKSLTKPTIKWKDVVNVFPKNGNQAKFEDSINFDQNGALRLMNVRGVTINGIKVDGGGRAPFGYTGVWNMKDPLFHGNAALDLWRSGDAVIKNCEFTNAYFGINVKDRNLGGVYANINPADLDTSKNVPLSGFGKTGNHLFENNRIHDNSWGMFFESTWDLGSVVRYNLFYENHHDEATALKLNTAIAAGGLKEADGQNQPGGAMLFKDMLLSPLAIYNNTFWHNYVVLGGHWKAGTQHLVFNNIVAEPYTYYATNKFFPNPYACIDPKFINRMHHCLYACQEKAPGKRSQKYNGGASDPGTNEYVQAESTITANDDQIRIMNGITTPTVQGMKFDLVIPLSTGDSLLPIKVDWATLPGAIMKDFAPGANVRWYEIKFLSTDPKSPDFLRPDYDDPITKDLVLDAGWPDAGVRDADGSVADLGAIPRDGIPTTEVVIKPTQPVLITGSTATATFNIYGLDNSSLKNLKVKYIRWIKDVPFVADVFGGAAKPIPETSIYSPAIPSTPLKMDGNSLTFSIPPRGDKELYAFFEIIAEGEDSKGNLVTTSVGFLPYRKLDYTFVVEVLNDRSVKIDTVRAGQVVTLSITPKRVGDSQKLTAPVKPVEVSLNSGTILFNSTTNQQLTFPDGFSGNKMETVYFTKAGTEVVSVSGLIKISATDSVAIMGASDPIVVLPGPPEKVAFSSPKSGSFDIVDPGTTFKVKVQVMDKYDNNVNTPTDVKVLSSLPNLIDFMNDAGGFAGAAGVSAKCDASGIAIFGAQVTATTLNDDTVPIVATLAINNATDNAKLVVGKPRAKFWIFFGDTANFDPSVEIKGCALSSRFPITLRASTDGKTILTDINAGFEIEADQQLVFYATQDDTVPITQSALKNGTLKIWVKGNRPVSNGVVTINSKDNTVLSSTRPGIVFEQCTPEVERAAYFGDGLGQVNRLEIYYSKELEAIYVPDSFLLYWPTISPNNARVVSGATNIIVDPNNSKHLTVKIPVPFGPENTFSSIKNLGSSYWSANKLSNDPPSISPFNISDSIGPLLMSATIVERIGDTGDDTLYLTLSEQINFKLLEGTSLTLLKNGSPVNLTVSSCTPFNGDTLKIVIPNGAANSPKYGDSLKILASGPVRDLYGNAAHVDNRPVKIGIKLIPPSIVSASYTDANGNGIVDLVTIKFDKKIVQGTVKIACSWLDLIISSDTLHGADILYDPNDSMLVRVNIEGKFRTNSARVIDKTSGSMDVAAMFDGFESVAKHHEAEDKAAPVIKSATYMPGRVDTITGTPLPDTLKVKFSESTVNVANSDKPFSVYHGTVEMAGFILGPASGNEECIYIVQQAEYFPVRDDSINIRATDSILSDGLGNIQIVPSNKKVQLEVKVVETVLKFVVGPNPFKPGVDELSIKIKPMSKMMENVNVKSTLVVVDQLGNKVWVKNLQTDTTLTDRTLEFKWNGRNRFGRTVSPGTYIAYLISEDLNTKTQVKHPPMFAIGVKK